MEGYDLLKANRDGAHPLWLRIVSGSVCILSLLGSATIILTYLFVKSVRSKARELLVHISAMDLLYTTANLVGLALPYHEHLVSNDAEVNGTETQYPSHYKTYHYVCLTQAFVAIYGTVGSILWTMGLAVYLYYKIVAGSDVKTIQKVQWMLYFFCYLSPLYVSLWLMFSHGLGYSPDITSGAGWCSLNTASGTNDSNHTLLIIMTYDVWIILGLILLLPLYLSIYTHVREMKLEMKDNYFFVRHTPERNNIVERKLLIVPVVFCFLRVWDLVNDILFVCFGQSSHELRHHKWLLLLTAIGDSGQGFANFIIFVLLQQKLRFMIMHCLCCGYCCHKRRWFLDQSRDENTGRSSSLLEPSNRSSSEFSQYTGTHSVK